MRKLLRVGILFFTYLCSNHLYSDDYSKPYSSSCTAYTDPYGPLKTGYTMGDVIRYAVGDNVANLYSPGGAMPFKTDNLAVADDVKSFGKNIYNLYNAIGYLYAGWLIFNNSLYEKLNGIDNTNPKLTFYNARDSWTSDYRSNSDYALDRFDNSKNFCSMIEIPSSYSPLMPPQVTSKITGSNGQRMTFENPSNEGVSYCSIGYNYIHAGDGSQTYGNDSFTNVSAHHTHADWASQSSGWCPNSGSGNWIPVVKNTNNQWYVAPTIQFFGARIAHILGVVVNDVPWSSDLSSSGATGLAASTASSSTPAASSTASAFHNPLISGSKTTLPMFAAMSGGPFKMNDSAIAEMIHPSQAHFGSLKTFITNLSQPTAGWTLPQQYLRKHILPTVSRLASVSSYGISTNSNSTNLIKINDDSVTAYDQGVVVAIQNNTGDSLTVNQVDSSNSKKIGTLLSGINNFYLHSASLMPVFSSAAGGSPSTTSLEPILTNTISIVDGAEQAKLQGSNYKNLSIAVYIQVLSGDQFNQIVDAVNTNLNNVFSNKLTSGALNWNHNQLATTSSLPISSGSTSSDTTPYLIISNFNTQDAIASPSTLSADPSTVLSYRIQAIDLSQFSGKPYLMTLQINKKDLYSGIDSKNQLTVGVDGAGFLYPSIVSCKLYTWQSVTDQKESNGNYSKIPLLMIPDSVWGGNIKGLKAYYLIWLMSYAAALTECSYNGAGFADGFGIYDKVFGLFSNTSSYRVVVDAQGTLASGEVLELDNTLKIMGSDTWDAGNGFNQDIPILNLSTNGTDNDGKPILVANSANAPFINLSATFGTSKINTANISDSSNTRFDTTYGLPLSNVMMFSVPTQALADGVNIEMTQPTPGNYQLVITSTKSFTSSDATLSAGSVLAAPQVFIDPSLYEVSHVIFDFLHVQGSTAWTSPQSQKPVSLGNTLRFKLKNSSANKLQITSISALAQKLAKVPAKTSAKVAAKTSAKLIASSLSASTKASSIQRTVPASTSRPSTGTSAQAKKLPKAKKTKKELEAEIAVLQAEIPVLQAEESQAS